ncbi:hypothetical protein T06_8282 [Trichinella sp. T6]|nr:hypothetical protein T06_8282 [Trichinella sp. T6]
MSLLGYTSPSENETQLYHTLCVHEICVPDRISSKHSLFLKVQSRTKKLKRKRRDSVFQQCLVNLCAVLKGTNVSK